MNSKTSYIEKLPVELLKYIFDILAESLHRREHHDSVHKMARGWLAQCQQTCQLFSALARPHLFRRVSMTSDASFDAKRIDKLLRLGNDLDPTSSPLCYIQVFEFEQASGCKLGWDVQNKIGHALHALLDLAGEHTGRLHTVAISLQGDRASREWGSLGDSLRGALNKIHLHRLDSVKTLRLQGFFKLPCEGVVFPFRLAALTLRYFNIELDEENEDFKQSLQAAAAEEGSSNPGQWDYRVPLSLDIDANPFNLSLIKHLGPQLASLAITTDRFNLYKLRTIGSLPTTPSTTPLFPKLEKLRIYVPTRLKITNYGERLIDFGSKHCQKLLKLFLVALPASHAPHLDRLEIVFELHVDHGSVGSPLEMPDGWMKQSWDRLDERLLSVLQMHTRRPGASPLPLDIVVRYEYRVIHMHNHPVKPYLLESEESLWTAEGLPRFRVGELLPLTSEWLARGVSVQGQFFIRYIPVSL